MITPQQIDQISFSKSTFGGYNMQQVDEILEPLTEDYVTLYKENALLKSKMRVLVGKLEEYRKNEAAVKDAAVNAKRAYDRMMQEAETKAAQMVQQAKAEAAAAAAMAAAPAPVVPAAPVAPKAAEPAPVVPAAAAPAPVVPAAAVAPKAAEPAKKDNFFDSDDIASQISMTLEAMVGTTQDTAPKAPPKHPSHESTTSRFTNLNLQFGRNYDPTH